jgi:hypothetical protein
VPWTAKQFKDRHAKGLTSAQAKRAAAQANAILRSPEIFNNYPQPFWRVDHRAPLIHHVPPKLAA